MSVSLSFTHLSSCKEPCPNIDEIQKVCASLYSRSSNSSSSDCLILSQPYMPFLLFLLDTRQPSCSSRLWIPPTVHAWPSHLCIPLKFRTSRKNFFLAPSVSKNLLSMNQPKVPCPKGGNQMFFKWDGRDRNIGVGGLGRLCVGELPSPYQPHQVDARIC